MNGNGYDNCGDKSDESKTDRPFCGMLKYVFVVITYILVTSESNMTQCLVKCNFLIIRVLFMSIFSRSISFWKKKTR